MRYQIQNGLVQYGANTIIKNLNFEIHDKEKIGVVGRNGCGKTTLLKVISNELELSNKGEENTNIVTAGEQYIGYLHQTNYENGDISTEEELKNAFSVIFKSEKRMQEIENLLKNTKENSDLLKEYDYLQRVMEAQRGYTWKQDMDIMFQKFGFDLEDLKKPVKNFSGGQQTKIAFIKLLLERPDILLLDEPTNHLDIETIRWLETYLKEYNKAVVIVSHDREFLDKVTSVTYEIEHHRIKRYKGNYSYYQNQKELDYEQTLKAYISQQKEIERLSTWVEKWKNTPSKASQARAKLKQIEHMDIIEKPLRFDTKTFNANFSPRQESYNEVLNVNKLQIGYDKVLSEVSFSLKKGDRLAIIGENGLGKSTLLKTIVNKIPSLGGTFIIGSNVDMAYFDQQVTNNDFNDSNLSVLEDFQNRFPNLSNNEARNTLAAFMFTQNEVNKKLSSLSGGEKVRLSLCKLFYTKPNFLILDEPTNHMDIIGKENLEKMLNSYSGTLLFVSHDRYFIRKVATSVLDFQNDNVTYYNMPYEEYLSLNKNEVEPEENENVKTAKPEQKEKKYINPEKDRNKLLKLKEKREKEIENIEQELIDLEYNISLPETASDYEEVLRLQENIDSLYQQEEDKMKEILDIENELITIETIISSRTHENKNSLQSN